MRRRLGPPAIGLAVLLALSGVAACDDGGRSDVVADAGEGEAGEPAPSPSPSPQEEPAPTPATPEVVAPAVDVATPAGETTCGAVTMYPLGTPGGRPTAVAPGADGSVWFTDAGTASIGHLTSAGTLARYAVLGGDPRSLASDGGGGVWATEAGQPPAIHHVTVDGSVDTFPLPTTTANPMGPSLFGALPTAITAGPDGAMWFVETGADQIGRITPDGAITELPLPTRATIHSHPSAITLGSDGAIWFSDTLRGMLGRVDPSTFEFSEIPYPGGQSAGTPMGNSMTTGPDGAIWYVDTRLPGIASLTPDGGPRSFPYGSPPTWPTGLTTSPDGVVWFVVSNPATVVRMTTDGQVAEWQLPADSGTIGEGGAAQVAAASDGAIWFAAPDSNALGRIPCG